MTPLMFAADNPALDRSFTQFFSPDELNAELPLLTEFMNRFMSSAACPIDLEFATCSICWTNWLESREIFDIACVPSVMFWLNFPALPAIFSIHWAMFW